MGEPFKDTDDVTLTELLEHQKHTIETLLESIPDLDATEDEIKEKIREFALKYLSTALATTADLVTNAEKETTQLAAAKTIINLASGTIDKDATSPLKALFEGLSKK